ncbi:(2Fe-2S)-binding protein [Halobacteriales archaeon QS_3_64_16]|nr:MAG: (2Fe-2S)-binding protein [Halobacteriales archaeon QS_3_64_16]
MSGASREIAYLRVEHEESEDESLLVAPIGATLRDVLLANGVSPYTAITDRLNCGGRGLCATCGVRFTGNKPVESATAEAEEDGSEDSHVPRPEHWHDELAARFGFPRLSCQTEVEEDMDVRIPEKIVWGSRRPDEGD